MPAARIRTRGAFVVDHIVARQHGGPTVLENLALSCPYCNRFKGPNIFGIDPAAGQPCRLFHPRQDRWAEHFRWDGIRIVGTTAIGRTTVSLLEMNDGARLVMRRDLLRSGWLLRPDL